MSSSFSLNSDIVRIVSIGTLDLTFHLSITKSQSKQLNINLNELNETKDLSVLFDNNISNNDESIIDYITLSSNNPLITMLLYINRAFKQRCFIEYITYNELFFSDELLFIKNLIKEVTQNNFLYIVQYRLKDIPSNLSLEIKILDDNTNKIIEKKSFNLFEKNYEVDDEITKSESCFFLFLNFSFTHDYFFADFSNLLYLKKYQYEEISLFFILLTSKFPSIKIITNFSNGLLSKNPQIQLLDTVKELINYTDIIIFESEELNRLYSLYNDTYEIKWDKKEFAIVSDKDKKRKHIQRISIILEEMKNIFILIQSGKHMELQEKTEYSLSSFYEDDDFRADIFKYIFLGGFFSRYLYGKTFNTCVTAGNLLVRKMIDVIKYNVDSITNLVYYQVIVPKLKSKIEDIKKYNKKIKERENNFVLDCVSTQSQKKDYNPLFDKYCQSFFASKTTRNHLHQLGFINKKGVILKNPGLRLPKINKESIRPRKKISIYSQSP